MLHDFLITLYLEIRNQPNTNSEYSASSIPRFSYLREFICGMTSFDGFLATWPPTQCHTWRVINLSPQDLDACWHKAANHKRSLSHHLPKVIPVPINRFMHQTGEVWLTGWGLRRLQAGMRFILTSWCWKVLLMWLFMMVYCYQPGALLYVNHFNDHYQLSGPVVKCPPWDWKIVAGWCQRL